MDGGDVTAAVVTVVLVAAGVILATVIMNRFGELLSQVERPDKRAGGGSGASTAVS